MKTIFKALLVLSGVLFVSEGQGQAPNWAWAKGGTGCDFGRANDIVRDASGNTYIIGGFGDQTISSAT